MRNPDICINNSISTVTLLPILEQGNIVSSWLFNQRGIDFEGLLMTKDMENEFKWTHVKYFPLNANMLLASLFISRGLN